MEYQIERVRTDDAALGEAVQILQATFPGKKKFTFDYIRWQYRDNPYGEIVGFNARYDKVLAAHYVAMPIAMMIEGRIVKGLLSMNTATHPEHQGKRLFTRLAECTYQYAAEVGYEYVIGVANANSTHGFLKNLGFSLVGPLQMRVGFGLDIYPEREYTYQRYWDEASTAWRLRNPAATYSGCQGRLVSPMFPGAKAIMSRDGFNVTNKCMWLHSLNLYIGVGATLSKGWYFSIPKFIKHSPFNLIFKDLSGKLPAVTPDNILFELVDFDVA